MMASGKLVGGFSAALILAYFAQALLPNIVRGFTTINTTGWGAPEIALIGIVGIIIVGGFVYGMYRMFMGNKL